MMAKWINYLYRIVRKGQSRLSCMVASSRYFPYPPNFSLRRIFRCAVKYSSTLWGQRPGATIPWTDEAVKLVARLVRPHFLINKKLFERILDHTLPVLQWSFWKICAQAMQQITMSHLSKGSHSLMLAIPRLVGLCRRYPGLTGWFPLIAGSQIPQSILKWSSIFRFWPSQFIS